MNPNQTHQGGKAQPGDNLTAIDEPPGAAEPVTQPTGRFLPASRYRHPGDVIRLIVSALVLTGTLAAVAVARRRLLSPGASAVTWPGSARELLFGPLTSGRGSRPAVTTVPSPECGKEPVLA